MRMRDDGAADPDGILETAGRAGMDVEDSFEVDFDDDDEGEDDDEDDEEELEDDELDDDFDGLLFADEEEED